MAAVRECNAIGCHSPPAGPRTTARSSSGCSSIAIRRSSKSCSVRVSAASSGPQSERYSSTSLITLSHWRRSGTPAEMAIVVVRMSKSQIRLIGSASWFPRISHSSSRTGR